MAKNRDLGGGTQRRRARLATAWLLPLLLGATPPAWAGETTERVSVGPHGRQADGASLAPALSMDGRFAAFKSDATNLVRGDTNGATDVFVRDRAKSTTERVSVGPGGVQGDGNSGGVFDFDTIAISADGRFVAFVSDATNLVPGDTNFSTDVFVRDRAKGVTERVSVGPGGVQANDVSFFPSLSADGRFVAFQSGATNLVPGDTGGGIYVRDRKLGTTERVDLGPGGVQANEAGFDPAISADGRFAAFATYATNLVPGGTNGHRNVFVRDRVKGTTELVSTRSDGAQATNDSEAPSLSAHGRFVAFVRVNCRTASFHTICTGYIRVRDRVAGKTTQFNVPPGGSVLNPDSRTPAISADGRFVAFASVADTFVSGDTNDTTDIFVRAR